jgi:hypothetical protein
MTKLSNFVGNWFAVVENMLNIFGMTIAIIILLILSSPVIVLALLVLFVAKLIDIVSCRSNYYKYLKDKLLEKRESYCFGTGGR